MKGLDNFSKRFLTICLGASAVLLSGSLFVSSINSATASESKESTFPNLSNANGRIMMDMEALSHDGERYQYILVWDTETGESKRYYLNWQTKQYTEGKSQLPENPLGY